MESTFFVNLQLLITVGGLGIAILAVAFALNDLSNQIDDNKDDLSSIKTDTTTLSNLFDDFSEEQANVCKLVRIFEWAVYEHLF